MNCDMQGVYSRMYASLSDHRRGLISFDEMLQHWKQEANAIKAAFQEDGKEDTSKAEEKRAS